MSDYKHNSALLSFLFHSNSYDVICHTNPAEPDKQIFTFCEEYSRYLSFMILPPICAQRMIIHSLDGAQCGRYPGESFAVNKSFLPLLYKLIYIIRRVQISPKKLDNARDNQHTYIHDIDWAESLLLAVVTGVEHEVWGDIKEGRLVRKYHLDSSLQDWLMASDALACARVPRINYLLDSLIARGTSAIDRFLDSEITRKAEYLNTIRNYLCLRALRPAFLRGDTVRINRYNQHAGYLLYDGKRIVNPLDNQQHPMYAITEFPLHYWFHHDICGTAININVDNFYVGNGVYNDKRPFLREACKSVGIEISAMNKIASFTLTSCGGNDHSMVLVEYDPKDRPSFNDLRNWILTSRKMWVVHERQNLICGGIYNPWILTMILAPLREYSLARAVAISQCKTLPSDLNSIIAEYARDYF